MRKRVDATRVTEALALAVMSVLCAVLLAAHYRDLSLGRIGIFLLISGGVAVLIAIPWLLISGSTLKRYLARAAAATLLLGAVGLVLVRLANTCGEEGTLLVVIVNIGAVVGALTIAALLGVGLTKIWRNRARGPD
jgi:uncharacterized membrane protein